MKHKSFQKSAFTACLLAGTALSTVGATADELQDLRDRIDTLEAQQVILNEQQTANTSTIPGGFSINRTSAIPDTDQIGDRNGLGRLSFALTENTNISIYGFVRAEAFYDFDFSQGDTSDPSALANPGNATSGDFEQSVRVSRFGIRSSTSTAIGEIGTQLEFDLFSEDFSTTSPDLRLRHANITVDAGRSQFLFGQFWSNFMPLVHYPTTADFEGPVGITFARVPQIRYTFEPVDGLVLSASLEEANGSINSEEPVVTAAAFYGTDIWSARIAGLFGTLPDGVGGNVNTQAVTVSGSVSPWAGGTFTGTYVAGEGIGNLLIGAGVGISDLADPNNPVANDAEGFTLEFRQDIGEKWNVGIAYGNDNFTFGTDADVANGISSFDESSTIHVNAFYTPVENFTYAIEYIYAEIEGDDGFQEDANRIGVSATLRF